MTVRMADVTIGRARRRMGIQETTHRRSASGMTIRQMGGEDTVGTRAAEAETGMEIVTETNGESGIEAKEATSPQRTHIGGTRLGRATQVDILDDQHCGTSTAQRLCFHFCSCNMDVLSCVIRQ